jgi:hypothetical protein
MCQSKLLTLGFLMFAGVAGAQEQAASTLDERASLHDSRTQVPSVSVNSLAKHPANLTKLAQSDSCFALRTYQFEGDGAGTDTTHFSKYSTCQPAAGRHFKSAVVLGGGGLR